MESIPGRCVDINSVRSFCECVSSSGEVDAAIKGFCSRALEGNGTSVTGDELAELKKAVKDLESSS